MWPTFRKPVILIYVLSHSDPLLSGILKHRVALSHRLQATAGGVKYRLAGQCGRNSYKL